MTLAVGVDKTGVMVPRAKNLIHFIVTGPGEIVKLPNNGDATDLSSFQTPDRKAFNGLALAIVKAKRGQRVITLTATSESMKAVSTTIKLK